MKTTRDGRMETLGGLRAVLAHPARTHTERQINEKIIPATINLIEDCNELEDQRNALLSALTGFFNDFGELEYSIDAMNKARAAIAKAKETA